MKSAILAMLFFISSAVFSQEIKNKEISDFNNADFQSKLKINSFGYGFGLFSTENNDGGLSAILELGLSYKKNLFLINFLSGSTVTILGPSGVDVKELNLQIGRELKVSSWFSVQGFAGLGYFTEDVKNKARNILGISTATFPVRIKLICYTGKYFALVSNNNYSINTTSSNFSSNLTFQHSF